MNLKNMVKNFFQKIRAYFENEFRKKYYFLIDALNSSQQQTLTFLQKMEDRIEEKSKQNHQLLLDKLNTDQEKQSDLIEQKFEQIHNQIIQMQLEQRNEYKEIKNRLSMIISIIGDFYKTNNELHKITLTEINKIKAHLQKEIELVNNNILNQNADINKKNEVLADIIREFCLKANEIDKNLNIQSKNIEKSIDEIQELMKIVAINNLISEMNIDKHLSQKRRRNH